MFGKNKRIQKLEKELDELKKELKKPLPLTITNIYSLLNQELIRLNSHLNKAMNNGNKNNVKVFDNRITDIHDRLFKILDEQPISSEQLKDLQDSVADLYLTGTESKD